jgi:PAS domain S-box-containing protein
LLAIRLQELAGSIEDENDSDESTVDSCLAHKTLEEVKEIEEALGADRNDLTSCSKPSIAGILAIDEKAKTIFVSRLIADILGYEPVEMIGRSIFCFVDDKWKKIAERCIERGRDGLSELQDVEFTRKDGSKTLTRLEVSSILGAEGRHEGAIVCISEIAFPKELIKKHLQMELLYDRIIDCVNDGIALHSLNKNQIPGKFLLANSIMSSLLGYTKKELLSMTPADIQEEEMCSPPCGASKPISLGDDLLFYRMLIAKDGRRIPAEIHSKVIDLNGRLASLSVVRNIAERRSMDMELEKSRIFLEKIINLIADPIFVKDREHRYILVNDAQATLVGIPKEKIIGKTASDLFPMEQADVFHERDDEVFNEGKSDINEETVTHADGSVRTVVTKKSLHRDPSGDDFLVGIAMDITERKRMEDKIRAALDELEEKVRQRMIELEHANQATMASRDQLRKIINSIGDPIFVKDRQHRLIHVNDAACKLFGKSRDEILNHTAFDLFPTKEMASISWEKDEEVFRTGIENVNEETNTYSPGKTMTVLVKKTPFTDDAGNMFLVGVTRDITDRKQAEKELLKAKEEAEAAVKSKSAFLANMSHEIRTPLNAIVGLTGLLLNAELTEEQRDYMQIVRSCGNSLLSVINDILDFSKIEGTKMDLEMQPFVLEECIHIAVDLMSVTASEKGLLLRYELHEGLPHAIIGDVTRLRQIIVNLVSNAIKFTEKGKVELHVKGRRLESGSFEIEFAVIDTGIGIPDDRQDLLFQSFTQVDDSITRRFGGTGLGLAICKKLVEMMNGRIWFESKQGVGSVFRFTIEAMAANRDLQSWETAQLRARKPKQKSISTSVRILLAEDNAVNQKVALKMLHYLGYNADVVANGLEVISALERQPYDVVLMDIQMPEMDGLSAARIIRDRWPDGPRIIAITAHALEGDQERCIQAGMDEYISKPINIEELRHALDRSFDPAGT